MSRKNKNYRAWLAQNINGTPKEAWDSAWEGAQKVFHARSMQKLEAEVARYRKGLSNIIAECSQENMDGEPYDTFYEIAQAALLEKGDGDG